MSENKSDPARVQGQIDTTSKLLRMVQKPVHARAERPPSNFALIWAQLFYNFVALVFDAIAAISVYQFTGGKWWYSVLVFLAGFLPLIMHEALFVRAYASSLQRTLALAGVGLSVITILVVGILAAVATIQGVFGLTARALEIGIMVALVIVSVSHGILAATYHFTDPGIRANQTRQDAIAYHKRARESLLLARSILSAANGSIEEEEKLIEEFGDPAAVEDVISQLTGLAPSKSGKAAADKLIHPIFSTPLRVAQPEDKGDGHKEPEMHRYYSTAGKPPLP